MAEITLNNIYLILLLPLWVFLIIMLGRFFSVYVNPKITGALTLLSSGAGVLLCAAALYKLPQGSVYETSYPFIHINNFIISCGIQTDKLGLVFALTLFLVSFLVQIFALSYMQGEKKNYRFFALLNLFNFGMTGLFFSPNLFQTYVFWEIVGIVSYLLIGFEYNKEAKSIASKKVFIMNRIGDTALIGGIVLCSYFMYQYAPDKSLATLSFCDMTTISTLVCVYSSKFLYWAICGLFILAAMVKSAQFLFYPWLQDAMEAKLPVSALLHSATLVAAGLFVTLRMTEFYSLDMRILKLIAIIGILTALVCSLCACAQRNPKKTLAYSTSAQFGLMYMGLGLLNIKACVAFFAAHAFIKSMLFITLPDKQKEWDYTSFILFLIGGLSLSGLVFSGMISKEMLALNFGNNATILFCIVSFLTAFYIIRIALVIADENGLEKRKPKVFEILPVIGLLAINIALYIYLRRYEYKIAEPFWFALFAWICVYLLYINKGFKKLPLIYPLAYNGFYLDKFYMNVCAKIYAVFSDICNWVDTKVFGEYRPIIYLSKSGVKISEFIETKIMDGGVNAIKKVAKGLSGIDLRVQNGNIQRYNAYAFIIITAIITCLIFAYVAIISFVGGI